MEKTLKFSDLRIGMRVRRIAPMPTWIHSETGSPPKPGEIHIITSLDPVTESFRIKGVKISINDLHYWTPEHWAKVGRPAETFR